MNKQIKVLIIDDSPIVREILTKGLSADSGILVVGAAADVFIGRDMIVKYRPDVITLDVEMPKMDGIEFLRRLMPQFPVPIVMVSSLTARGQAVTMKALELGAVDFIAKPSSSDQNSLNDMILELRTKIKIASIANVSHWKIKNHETINKNVPSNQNQTNQQSLFKNKIIAIGASTGGTEAISNVIKNLPPYLPCIVITQHMPSGFTKTFANRLNEISLMTVKEAETGDKIEPGMVYIAPGDYHMYITSKANEKYILIKNGDKINGHRPSVDPMMISVAEQYGDNAMGIILTGMGSDGSIGLKKMRDMGSHTIGQDQASSVVYGMPRVAFELGAVEKQMPLDSISNHIINIFKLKN